MKRIFIFIGIAAVLIGGLTITGDSLMKARREIKRLISNQTTLLGVNEKNRLLNLKVGELSQVLEHERKLSRYLRDTIKIKDRKIRQLTKTVMDNSLNQTVKIVTDTIYRHDSVIIDKSFLWIDPWTRITGKIGNEVVDLSFSSTDTVYSVVYISKEGNFLPALFGKSVAKTTTYNVNPHNKITIDKFIEVYFVRKNKKRLL